MKTQKITYTVWILSFVSLFTDLASEMLYPVMPLYLRDIGFSVLLIGLLEGMAEALAGLSKGYFGQLSDLTGRRMPLVRLGYTFSALSKPLMAVFTLPVWVFMVRCIDRLGKGMRTGARDAILSAESTSETKGRIFGFHRSMDTLGAVIGPFLAIGLLALFPQNYTFIFLLAFIPGLAAVGLTLFLRDKPLYHVPETKPRIRFLSFIGFWKDAPDNYRKLASTLLAFTLINSTDVFLLLKAKETGLSDQVVIGMYISYNLVYALMAFPFGIWADKIGLKKVMTAGIFIFALTYFLMGMVTSTPGFVLVFTLYGCYAACTEGLSKAWISSLVLPEQTATAIGTFTAFQSIASLFASTMAGLIWYALGSDYLFFGTGICALIISGVMLRYVPYRHPTSQVG